MSTHRLLSLRHLRADMLVKMELPQLNPTVESTIRLSGNYHNPSNSKLTYEWEGLSKSIRGMDEYFPMNHGAKKRGVATLTIIDERLMRQAHNKRFSDLFDDPYYTFHNAKVTIYLYGEGMSALEITDAIIYTGKIESYGVAKNLITFKIIPGEQNELLPPWVLSAGDYANLDGASEGKSLPIILGKLYNEGVTGQGLTLDDYGGALTLNHKINTASHYVLVAGHPCNAVPNLWDSNNVSKLSLYDWSNGAAGGPAWRIVCYVHPDGFSPRVGNTVDAEGLEDQGDLANGPGSGTLLECPKDCFEQILRTFSGKTNWDIDTTAGAFGQSASDWKCWGVLEKQNPLLKVAERFNRQFQFYIWRNKDGKFTIKAHEPFPTVSYSPILSPGEGVQLGPIKKITTAANNVVLPFWQNHGNEIKATKIWQPELGREFLLTAFIRCVPQYSKVELSANLTATATTITHDACTMGTFVNGDLILIDSEIVEVYNQLTTTTTQVFTRSYGPVGTQNTNHLENAPIYILRTSSSNGNGLADQHAYPPTYPCEKIYIYEDATHYAEVTTAGGISFFSDPERWARRIASDITNNASLQWDYHGNWCAETNRFNIWANGDFRIRPSQVTGNDTLCEMMGFIADTGSAQHHWSDAPAWEREAQAAYGYVHYGVNKTLKVEGDLIRGEGLALADTCPTAQAGRNVRFDTNWKPFVEAEIVTPLRFVDLLAGDTAGMSADFDSVKKVFGRSWENIVWRVIKKYYPDENHIGFTLRELWNGVT